MNKEVRAESKWLLLIHNIPPKPSYLRVKVWRRLQRLGAIAIKNSVYALPQGERFMESFQWMRQEISQGGGEASICEASFVDGLNNHEIEGYFQKARDADYERIAREGREILKEHKSASVKKISDKRRRDLEIEISRIRKAFNETVEVDFFGANRREIAQSVVGSLEKLTREANSSSLPSLRRVARGELQNRTWVTRKGVHVDRIASAWLIRRFIDSSAKFQFVDGKTYKPVAGTLRFDMYQGEFTHEGELCTFEVLMERAGLREAALKKISQVIHDIDLKDSRYELDQTAGIEALISGVCLAHKSDEDRISRGSAIFDELYEFFRRIQK